MNPARTALILLVMNAIGLLTLAGQEPVVHLWMTTSDEAGVIKGLEQQPDIVFTASHSEAPITVEIDDRKTFQKMEGGGASFTDGAAWLINQKLSPAQREEVMLRLFDPHIGIGVNFLRNPMGSSDLTRKWYTYDDNESDKTDASLPHFSIDHDRADVLPLTKWARKINPDLALMMNAW